MYRNQQNPSRNRGPASVPDPTVNKVAVMHVPSTGNPDLDKLLHLLPDDPAGMNSLPGPDTPSNRHAAPGQLGTRRGPRGEYRKPPLSTGQLDAADAQALKILKKEFGPESDEFRMGGNVWDELRIHALDSYSKFVTTHREGKGILSADGEKLIKDIAEGVFGKATPYNEDTKDAIVRDLLDHLIPRTVS